MAENVPDPVALISHPFGRYVNDGDAVILELEADRDVVACTAVEFDDRVEIAVYLAAPQNGVTIALTNILRRFGWVSLERPLADRVVVDTVTRRVRAPIDA